MTVWRKKYSYCLPDCGYIYSTCVLHKKRHHCLHPILWYWVVACCQDSKNILSMYYNWPSIKCMATLRVNHQRPLNGGYIDCSIEAHNNLASSLIETLLYFWGQWGHYYWIGLLSSAILFCNYFWTLINGGLIESSTAVISGNQSNEQLLSYSKPSCFSW